MDDGARTRVRALGVWAVAVALFAAVPIGIAAPGNGNGDAKSQCNAGRGNGSEGGPDGTTADGLYRNDCDPGNSAAHNMGGDHAYTPTG